MAEMLGPTGLEHARIAGAFGWRSWVPAWHSGMNMVGECHWQQSQFVIAGVTIQLTLSQGLISCAGHAC